MHLATMQVRFTNVLITLMVAAMFIAAPAIANGSDSSNPKAGQQQERGSGGAADYGTSGKRQQGGGAWGKSGDTHDKGYGTSGKGQQGSGAWGDSDDKGRGTGNTGQQGGYPR